MKSKTVCFTIVQNDADRFNTWFRHYYKSFCPKPSWKNGAAKEEMEDIFVLDHDSPDRDFEDDLCEVVPVHNTESFNHTWLRDVVQDFQRFLLNSYECVLFSEVDELIVHERGLGTFIDEFLGSPQVTARCRGVEIVERDGKPSYESSHWYDKTLISKIPLHWSVGFHECHSQWPNILPDLWLVHTHRQNYAACRARHHETAKRKWSPADIASGAGAHNRIESDAEFDKWFFRHDGPVIELPESVLKQLSQ